MFEYIYSHFDTPGFFRLFNYVSFRSLLAGLFAMGFSFICGNRIIYQLQRLNFQETIRSDGPKSHLSKQGTPTMGGILILASLSLACLLFGNFSNLHFVLLFCCTLLFGCIGFSDDWVKITSSKRRGISGKLKLLLTIAISLLFCAIYYWITPETQGGGRSVSYGITGIFIPFLKGEAFRLPLLLMICFWILVIVGSSHAVNLTDGLDGLAIGNVSIVAVTIGILAYITGTPLAANYLNIPYVEGAHEVTVFLAALTGAGVGFLWFNAAPARIFMGDVGSLALGSALGMSAIILKKELLLALVGGVFVMEAGSVILQVISFKLRRRRIFKMSPLHHHFELSGWPETRVVIRFWLLGIILSLLALSTLRIQ